MDHPMDDKLFDVRVIERHLRNGTVTREQYAAYLESLPDESERAELLSTRFSSLHGERWHGADQGQEEEEDLD
jgi:hypothetical protein